jgi:hypothetical protein
VKRRRFATAFPSQSPRGSNDGVESGNGKHNNTHIGPRAQEKLADRVIVVLSYPV